MQPYNCPKCGTKEPGMHRDDCNLAGHPVWPGYDPPDWSKAEQLLAEKLEEWRRQWPGYMVLIDGETLDVKLAADMKQAFPSDPQYNLFGPTPPTGRMLLVQRLQTDEELGAARKRKEALLDSPA